MNKNDINSYFIQHKNKKILKSRKFNFFMFISVFYTNFFCSVRNIKHNFIQKVFGNGMTFQFKALFKKAIGRRSDNEWYMPKTNFNIIFFEKKNFFLLFLSDKIARKD